jgi:hypothetical protein
MIHTTDETTAMAEETDEDVTAEDALTTNVQSYRARLEDYARSEPIRATAGAALCGYALHFLPLRAMISAAARLALPAAVAYGAWKALGGRVRNE